MIIKIFSGVGAAIGCRFLKKRNQLVFVEYNKGAISLLDMIRPVKKIVSKGITVLKGTWVFDCETGVLGGNLSGPGDIWWEQIDSIKRQMMPVGGASIVNLGKVNFNSVTPAVLQSLVYSKTPIPGNNDATNQLVKNDVFAVRTNAGNIAKIKVVQYGYDMKIKWETYKLASPYHLIGTGYSKPEDIAVCAGEKTAYVTERTGNLLKVDLNNANRPAAVVIASGIQSPQQIHLDEIRQQAYVVEYANPGNLIRIDLTTKQKTVLLSGLKNAVGLLVSSDLAYAYISEQSSGGGCVSQYSLQDGTRVEIASGLTNPFFLTWADPAQTAMFVAERDPANRITIVETVPHPGSVRQVVNNTGVRPSSVAVLDAARLLVCCDQEINLANLFEGIVPTGLFKGIGLVPWNLITANGKADTTTQPKYPYQFAKNAPFGGALSLQINHLLAWQKVVKYYRVLVDGEIRLDTWWDLKLNPANGKYEIPVQSKPKVIGGKSGYYAIHKPGEWFMNTDLGMMLNSTTLANGQRSFTIEFTDNAGNMMQSHAQKVWIDNNLCTASIEMPTVNSDSATTNCGMLKFASLTKKVKIVYVASHPTPSFATYSWRLGRAGKGPLSAIPGCIIDGPVSLVPFTFKQEVGNLLGTCSSAAFYASVYVYAMAINGISRQSQYDASSTVAFALTP